MIGDANDLVDGSPTKRSRVVDAAARPAGRYAETDALTGRALRSDARAVTRGDILPGPAGQGTIFPRYVSRAQGPYVWDVDGNRYIDYLLGYGPIVLGHADERVDAAVVAELAKGTCTSPLWSPLQVELTELLVSVIPGGELAYLLKTGSDATTAAVRLARIFTGRSKVVRWGYNGWHDWSALDPDGVPPVTWAETFTFRYNDIESLRAIFARHPHEIACVVMMPYELDAPLPGFLQDVREVAHAHGALFVLDEMRSGFRIALGGAQEFFGVRADAATFSKAMSNGYAISAIVGREDVLRCLARTKISSAFYANAPEMAAALTTIAILRDSDALSRVEAAGRRLQEGLRALVAEFGVPAEIVGYPHAPFLRYLVGDAARKAFVETAFYAETTRRGVLFHPSHHWFVSAAHTEDDVDETLAACRHGFEAVSRHLDCGSVPGAVDG